MPVEKCLKSNKIKANVQIIQWFMACVFSKINIHRFDFFFFLAHAFFVFRLCRSVASHLEIKYTIAIGDWNWKYSHFIITIQFAVVHVFPRSTIPITLRPEIILKYKSMYALLKRYQLCTRGKNNIMLAALMYYL